MHQRRFGDAIQKLSDAQDDVNRHQGAVDSAQGQLNRDTDDFNHTDEWDVIERARLVSHSDHSCVLLS